MAVQRILQATTGSLSWQPLDGDGEPGDPGVVTVGVTRSDGTEVIAAGTATTDTDAAPRTIALTVAQSAQLDVLTATWKVGSDTVAVTEHLTVGGFLYSLSQLRSIEPSTSDASRDTAESARRVRDEVEHVFENATGVPWTPRLRVVRELTPDGSFLYSGTRFVRTVRWCRLWSDWETYTSLTSDECAAIPPSEAGWLRLPYSVTGSMMITAGVEVGYFEASPVGMQAPSDVTREALVAARAGLNRSRVGIPDRATSMQMQDGSSVTLATPGVGNWHTGIPSVDEMLRRRDRRSVGTWI